MPYHSHYYSGITSFENGHIHGYEGITTLAPTGVPHVHYIQGITTYDDGHVHTYWLTTIQALVNTKIYNFLYYKLINIGGFVFIVNILLSL